MCSGARRLRRGEKGSAGARTTTDWKYKLAFYIQAAPGADAMRHRRAWPLAMNRDMILRVMKKREEGAPKLADTLCGQDRPTQWLAMDGLTFA